MIYILPFAEKENEFATVKKRAPNLLGYVPRRRFREKRKCPRPPKQKGQQRNLKKKKNDRSLKEIAEESIVIEKL